MLKRNNYFYSYIWLLLKPKKLCHYRHRFLELFIAINVKVSPIFMIWAPLGISKIVDNIHSPLLTILIK